MDKSRTSLPSEVAPRINRRELITSAATLLASPMLASPMHTAHGASRRRARQLTARPGLADITNNKTPETRIWGYDGQVPGPVLRVKQDEELAITLVNELEQPTSIHWHGIRITNNMDGSPLVQPAVEPGDAFEYRFSSPDAGTYWYHTHTRGFEQLTRGLYGVLIVDETTQPAEKFDDEIILAIDDWLLGKDGQIETESIGSMMNMSHGGRTGNWASVNGINKPSMPVQRGARLRARLVNTSNARILDLTFDDLKAWVIALDGQPVAPAQLDAPLTLAPGQRADLAIDIPVSGEDAYVIGIDLGQSTYTAATLQPTSSPALPGRDSAPAPLPPNTQQSHRLDLARSHHVELIMEGGAMGSMREATLGGVAMPIRKLVREGKAWAFNGLADSDIQAPLFDVKQGTTVSIDIHNLTAWPHAMHTHGHHFRHTHTDGVEVAVPGAWRDTHLMERGERHSLSLVADNPGDWLVHCHMVDHAASGMSGWFRVRP